MPRLIKGHRYIKSHRYARHSGALSDREVLSLAAYFSDDPATRNNARQSALAGGYPATDWSAFCKLLRKFNRGKFQAALAACGIDNLRMAMRLRRMIDSPVDKDALPAIRLAQANLGMTTDETRGSAMTVNIERMMIVGSTPDKLKALRGALPQLTKAQSQAQQEETDNARCADRLAQLKRGELTPMRGKHYNDTHRKGKAAEAIEAEVSDIHRDDTQPHLETGTPAGELPDREGYGDAPLPVGDAI